LGIMLDPARSREVLGELAVRPAADTAATVEHQHRRPGGTLVDRDDEALRVAGQTNSPRRRLTASLTSPCRRSRSRALKPRISRRSRDPRAGGSTGSPPWIVPLCGRGATAAGAPTAGK